MCYVNLRVNLMIRITIIFRYDEAMTENGESKLFRKYMIKN